MTTTTQKPFLIGTAAMTAVLLSANFLFFVPITDWLNGSAFVYPMIYLVCDCMNRLYGPALARRVVLAGLVIGVPLSFVFVYVSIGGDALQAARVAGASGVSFILSQLTNISVFNRLRQRAWWQAPFVSSVLAYVVDTPIFFLLAFTGTGLPWTTWLSGNILGKMVMAVVLLPVYRAITRRVIDN